MRPEERWDFLVQLDDEMLGGGVILSEWSTVLVRDADTAFANGAFLSAIFAAMAGIETHLRSECKGSRPLRLVDLITAADVSADTKNDLHQLRRYRNNWVHVESPWNDEPLIARPSEFEHEMELMASLAMRTLRKVIYANQFV
ncbi:MAG: hypothetical protein U1F54_17940 [Burkholderiales bacterium]